MFFYLDSATSTQKAGTPACDGAPVLLSIFCHTTQKGTARSLENPYSILHVSPVFSFQFVNLIIFIFLHDLSFTGANGMFVTPGGSGDTAEA